LGLALDEPTEKDATLLLNDIQVVIEKNLVSFVDEQVVDYISSAEGEGLVIAPAWGTSACS
jgi:Fe-S cluster assembly iron-binding protein IscA